jgi:hypothetical protein
MDKSSGYDSSTGPVSRDDHHSHGSSSGSKKEPKMWTRPDYMNSTTSATISAASSLDVFVLSSPGTLKGRQSVGTLMLGDMLEGGKVTSRPFSCKAQTKVALQVVCPGDCRWKFGLQGMTIDSWTMGSANKTGFSLKQYEGLECIKN